MLSCLSASSLINNFYAISNVVDFLTMEVKTILSIGRGEHTDIYGLPIINYHLFSTYYTLDTRSEIFLISSHFTSICAP